MHKKLLFAIISLLFFGCKTGNHSDENEKFTMMKEFVLGKKFSVSILSDTHCLPCSNSLFFVFNVEDCSDCIKKGFDFHNYYLNRTNENDITFISVFSDCSDCAKNQIINNYDFKGPVCFDKEGEILKSLNSIETPFLIRINKKKEIENVIFLKEELDESFSKMYIRMTSP